MTVKRLTRQSVAGHRRQGRRVQRRRHADAKDCWRTCRSCCIATRSVCIIGLGSGVTLASALTHPIAGVDVVEISPEVVEASHLFTAENHRALDDPRTRLILGDGRSHLAAVFARNTTSIISEPSNPWMAGVAALFTREFFAAVRDRLAPGGIVCQWAHTYDISDRRSAVDRGDVRIGVSRGHDVARRRRGLAARRLAAPLDQRLGSIDAGGSFQASRTISRRCRCASPFGLLSMFVGGPAELELFGAGADIQTRRSDGARVLRPSLAQWARRRNQLRQTANAPFRTPAAAADRPGAGVGRIGAVARPWDDDGRRRRPRRRVSGLHDRGARRPDGSRSASRHRERGRAVASRGRGARFSQISRRGESGDARPADRPFEAGGGDGCVCRGSGRRKRGLPHRADPAGGARAAGVACTPMSAMPPSSTPWSPS